MFEDVYLTAGSCRKYEWNIIIIQVRMYYYQLWLNRPRRKCISDVNCEDEGANMCTELHMMLTYKDMPRIGE